MSVERSPEALQVQVLIPALNEALALPRVLQGLQAQGLARILVVDNGSTDGTAAAARAGGAQVVIEPRRGYGQACWAGLQSLAGQTPEARAPWVLFVDADAGDDLIALPCFLAAAAQGADLVLGNRLARPASRASLAPLQRWGSRLATRLIRWGWRHRYQDLGPMRLVRRDLLERLAMRDRGFGWTVEMQIRAIEEGATIVEIDVDHRPRREGRSKIAGTVRGTVLAGMGILSTVARLWWQRRGRVAGALHAAGRRRAAKAWMAAAGVVTLAACASVWMSNSSAPRTLAEMTQRVRAEFPQVQQMSTAALAAWLADSARSPPQLLDVREAEEYAVSHLPGAVHVAPGADIGEVLDRIDLSRPVVLYCSVGWRSSLMAARLQGAGIEDVHNLEGSIFAWAGESRPLVAGGRPAVQVHPYDEDFGRLLEERLRAR